MERSSVLAAEKFLNQFVAALCVVQVQRMSHYIQIFVVVLLSLLDQIL
jgi:hypothetical protein